MCTRAPKEEIYDFFDNIEDYIENVKIAKGTASSSIDVSECNSFMETYRSYFRVEETAKIICKEFIDLYKSLSDVTCTSNSHTKYKKCSEFLNYWVNIKLKESMKNEGHFVSDVYDHLESQIWNMSGLKININCKYIYDISKDVLHKMNILYSLYGKYTDISTILENTYNRDKELLLSLSTSCCSDYLEANYICNVDNNNNREFCEKIETFKRKYNELYGKFEIERPEISDNFIKLSECPNNKIITTAVTGTVVGLIPLFGVLYKFTPMGQVLRSKMGILNNDIRNNDEEMTNISLMGQENEHIPFQKGTYNIKYHSV